MVAGHICLDITPVFNSESRGTFGEIFCPGKLINVGPAVFSTGGAVANTGLAMAKLGLDVRLNCKVGDDIIGDLIKKVIGSERAVSCKTVSGQNSSYSVVLAPPGMDRVFLHNPGTNDTFTAEDIDYEALRQCRLLHFGYPTLMKRMYEDEGRELVRIFQRARNMGVVTSLDMTVPDPESPSGRADWPAILKRVLPWVDIFLPSIEEIAYMLDRRLFEKRKAQAGREDPVLCYTAEDCHRLSQRMLDLGVKIAAIKMGIKGYYLRTAGRETLKSLTPLKAGLEEWSNRQLWAPSYRADTFGSATGAGDATIAGFLTAFLHGLGPIQAIKVANMLGWQNVREIDALSGIEDWPTTLAMIQDDGKRLNPLVINEKGWRLCEASRVYLGPDDRQS